MTDRQLLELEATELTKEEFTRMLKVKRSIYSKLLEIVDGDTIKEKDSNILKLKREEILDLVFGGIDEEES